MSDALKHECGVALLRLRKKGNHYCTRYGTSDWGGAKLSLLLEKQHNRGQDGAGAAILRARPVPGEPPCALFRSASESPLADLLAQIARRPVAEDESVFLGHLRYATFGKGDVAFCHPFVHTAPRLEQTLLLAGNFNLTNTHELFDAFRAGGNHPVASADGYLLCELLADELARSLQSAQEHPLLQALRALLPKLDGAFALCGMTGDGWSFAVRDPHGIRPCFYLVSDEVAVVASERPAIQAAFDCAPNDVKELSPGTALLVSPDGEVAQESVIPAGRKSSCSFERIYFSRANDADIHRERKALGAALAEPLLRAVDGDLAHTFFSYIPNSAQVAFHGLLEALWTEGLAEGRPVRFGQVAVKDAKFRTFIADAAARREFYQHVYDVTYGLVRPGEDTLVVLDDSIVRGNTMKRAILPMLDRLGPKRIVIASSAPPIRYPDCYGIDMSTLGELVAFRALVNLLGKDAEAELRAALDASRTSGDEDQAPVPEPAALNPLASLYARFDAEEHAAEIARLLTPSGLKAEVSVVFQTVEALHLACPNDTGAWYFTGSYPTPGGYRVLHTALANYLERNNERSY